MMDGIELLRSRLEDSSSMEIGFNPVYTVDSQSMWAFSQDDQTNPNWRYSVVPNWQKYKAGEFPGANRQTRYYAISVTVPPLSQGYPLFELGVYSREGVIMYVNGVEVARKHMPA